MARLKTRTKVDRVSESRGRFFYDHNIAEVGISGSYGTCIACRSARLDDKDGSGSSIPATS